MKMRCYVGEWNARPIGSNVDPTVFNLVHPNDFLKVAEQHKKERPDVDVWTNNPYVVSAFNPEEVFVCCRFDGDVPAVRGDIYRLHRGGIVCRPITDHPKYKKWKDEMTPGEMWSLFGERWVLGDENQPD